MIEPYYQDNLITIYHADCKDVLPQLGEFDLLLTDPPYGIGEAANNNASRSLLATSKDYGFSKWDDTTADDAVALAISICKRAIVWGGNYYNLPPSPTWIVWDKQNGKTDFADVEMAWSNMGGAARLFSFMWHGMLRAEPGERSHPTQKPRSLMEFCINLAEKKKPVTSILDPFLGSGTTLVAARRNGIRAVGIDREEKYCEIAVQRVQQRSLFEAS